jgi:HD-GYP domain-containing protein (c-di-GMP phosphodiesterase class II)
LINQVDQAMYAAKWGGRNRVEIWTEQMVQQVRNLRIQDEETTISIQHRLNQGNAEAARIYDETIEGWARALELRDKETEGHAQRVTAMTIALSQRLGIDNQDLVDIRRGALLHDIGKIAIPDNILFKPGKLTEAEWEVMKKHPVYAYELLSPITYLQKAIDIPYCHHEHWDGNGYPRHLKGYEIPLPARIFTIIDVWDALRTDRCYRAAWGDKETEAYIIANKEILFDPDIVDIFLEMLNQTEITDHLPVTGKGMALSTICA